LLVLLSPLFSILTAPSDIYTLSLHDALPILSLVLRAFRAVIDLPAVKIHFHLIAGLDILRRLRALDDRKTDVDRVPEAAQNIERSEEHTSELQSRFDLVCRLLLEKKNKTPNE